MAGEEPLFKKKKLNDENGNIFRSFHQKHQRSLQSALYLIDHEQSGYGVGLVKIKVCNAQSAKRFCLATCDCEELCAPSASGSVSEPEGYGLSGIFQYGFDMLESYVDSPEHIPLKKGARIALEKLLTFLSNKGPAEKALNDGDVTDTIWTTRVVHHLLSKLAISSNYTLDSQYKQQNRDLKCNCGCGEKLSGQYGDTSLGVPSYWHGRVDMVIDVAVTAFAKKEPDSHCEKDNNSFKKKSKLDIMAASREQIRAETIVYSFLQKKNHPELDNFLIPTIAMSKTQVAICFYDSEKDIFLETPRLDLFHEGRFLKIATVLTIWFALNFKYCCSGVPDEIIETGYKADFFRHVGSVLEEYSEDVMSPCDYQCTSDWLALPSFKKVRKIVNNVNQIHRVT